MKTTNFSLKCVGCGNIEVRPANNCSQQPMCSKCYSPMVIQTATSEEPKHGKEITT